MQKCVIYARYSPGGNQTFQSIEGQLRVCKQFAKDNDLNIVTTYADEHMTGKNDNRPEFRKMIKDSAKCNWEFVIVYSIDRFARNRIESSLNKYALQKNGVVLLSATQKTSENADGSKNLDGILLESLYEGMAEYYSEELSQKVRRGQNESVEKGNFLGGPIPYGYNIVNKKYVINEAQAEVVKRIFGEYREGKTVDAIIQGLTNDCIYNNFNRKFSKTAVMNIFTCERYIGNLVFGDLRHDNCIPAIVSNKDFNFAQKRME
ncbi:MAG: recombinase family protein, partial [Oscillospiraceae bacterium]